MLRCLVAAVLGAAAGIAIGYFVYAVNPLHSYGFVDWITNPEIGQDDAILWTSIGTLVALCVSFLRAWHRGSERGA